MKVSEVNCLDKLAEIIEESIVNNNGELLVQAIKDIELENDEVMTIADLCEQIYDDERLY